MVQFISRPEGFEIAKILPQMNFENYCLRKQSSRMLDLQPFE